MRFGIGSNSVNDFVAANFIFEKGAVVACTPTLIV